MTPFPTDTLFLWQDRLDCLNLLTRLRELARSDSADLLSTSTDHQTVIAQQPAFAPLHANRIVTPALATIILAMPA